MLWLSWIDVRQCALMRTPVIGQRYGVHPVLVGQWEEAAARAADAFRRESASSDDDRVRDELLKKIGDATLAEAQVGIARWIRFYNVRPHQALENRAPMGYSEDGSRWCRRWGPPQASSLIVIFTTSRAALPRRSKAASSSRFA